MKKLAYSRSSGHENAPHVAVINELRGIKISVDQLVKIGARVRGFTWAHVCSVKEKEGYNVEEENRDKKAHIHRRNRKIDNTPERF